MNGDGRHRRWFFLAAAAAECRRRIAGFEIQHLTHRVQDSTVTLRGRSCATESIDVSRRTALPRPCDARRLSIFVLFFFSLLIRAVFFFLLNVQSQRDTLRQLSWKSPLVRGAKLGPFLQKRAGLRGGNFRGWKSSKNIERRMCCFACKKKKKRFPSFNWRCVYVFVCTNVLPSRKCWWNENDLLNCLRDS